MTHAKQNALVWGILFLSSLACHFFCNLFSPIFLQQFEHDQLMFYMVGKAWVNGMIPYVDFIDVKGPLLFLFYAIGYLLTPNETGGVYLLLVILTTISLRYIYRTGKALGLSSPMALLACILSLFAFFNKASSGGRAEDILHPFIAALIYYFVCYLSTSICSTKTLSKLGWATGISIAAALLIKYNNVLPGALVAVIVLFLEIKNKQFKRYFFRFAPCCLGGLLVLLLPFIAILLYEGNLDDCISTYFFVNNSSAVFLTNPITHPVIFFVKTVFVTTQTGINSIYLIIAITFLTPRLFPDQVDKKSRIVLLFFFLIIYLSCLPFRDYYLIICAPFFGLTAIAITKRVKSLSFRAVCVIIPCVVLMVISCNGEWSTRCPYSFTEKVHPSLQALEQELKSTPNPKLLYYDSLDCGFGLECGALPGAPYWTKLNGLGDVCRASHIKAIKARIPDYIIRGSNIPNDSLAFFKSCGYELQGEYNISIKNRRTTQTFTLFKKGNK